MALHDTWYVVGHFHYLVAPGTVFAIFAGVYHWFPKVTGTSLNHGLGMLHFWGSFLAMNGVFLPMFTLGLRGINRRLYDAGLQFANGAGGRSGERAHHAGGLCARPRAASVPHQPRDEPVARRAGRRQSRGRRRRWNGRRARRRRTGNFATAPLVHRGAYDYSVPGQARDFVAQGEPG